MAKSKRQKVRLYNLAKSDVDLIMEFKELVGCMVLDDKDDYMGHLKIVFKALVEWVENARPAVVRQNE